MRADQHIGKGQQARKHVVGEDVAAVVGEEQVGLLLVDVDGQAAEPAALERADHGLGVDHRAAAGVDEDGATRHARQALGVDQVVGVGVQRALQQQHAAARQQLVQRHVGRRHLGVREGIVRQHLAAQALEDPQHAAPDAPGADHADGLAVQVEAEQSVELEIALAHPGRRAVRLAHQGQQQRQRVFGHRVRRVLGHTRHRQPKLLRGLQVDVVEAGTAQQHQAHAELLQALEHRGVEAVVDEHADRLVPGGGGHRLGAEVGLDVAEAARPGGLEALAVVALGTEEGNTHGVQVSNQGSSGRLSKTLRRPSLQPWCSCWK